MRVIAVLGLAFGILLALALLASGPAVVDATANHAARQKTVSELVMESRQTAPHNAPPRSAAALYGAGLLAVALLGIGAVLVMMRGGTDFLKQLRLMRRQARRSPHQSWQQAINEVPPVQPLRRLPGMVEDENKHQDYYG